MICEREYVSKVSYRVRLLRVAEDDLKDIVSCVSSDNPSAALMLLDRFEKKLSQLAAIPHSGSAAAESSLASLGYRYLVLDNYLIFYVIQGKVVLIHRVLHGARDYKRLL